MAKQRGEVCGWWVAMALLLCVALPTVSSLSCSTDVSTKATFATDKLQCQAYSVGGSNNQFYVWALKDNATDPTSMVVAVPVASGNWAAIGFSSTGEMVGSTALVATLSSAGVANATVYALNGQSPSAVVPSTGLSFPDGSVQTSYDGTYVYMSCQVDFNSSTPANPGFLLFAYGPLTSSNGLQKHSSTYTGPATYITGVSAGRSKVSEINKKKKVHGWLNIVGWGLFLPIGAMVARYARAFDPAWFYSHIGFQIVGFGCILAGIVTGVDLVNNHLAPDQLDAHRGLGIFIFVLAGLQILAVVARPKKDAKVRKYWNWYHHWVGRVALVLAVVNIFVGLHMSEAEHSMRVTYISFLCIELAAFVLLEVLLWVQWFRKRSSREPSAPHADNFQFGGSV